MTNTAAMSMAEGDPRFRMDVSLVFGGTQERQQVLRTCLDPLDVWSSKYAQVNKSPFDADIDSITKQAAIIYS